MTSSRSGSPDAKRVSIAPPAAVGKAAKPDVDGGPGATSGSWGGAGAGRPDGPAPRGSEHADQTMLLVGARIRGLRMRQGLTLKDVAERTGVSVSMLSMLERGLATGSIGTLVAVASALGIHMYDLFDHPQASDGSPVTRLSEQTVVRTGEGATRRVAHHDPAAGLEFAVNEYEPDGTSGLSSTHHEGREFGVVVSGRLTIEIEGESHELEVGDVIAYSSKRPHRIANRGRERAVAVWVNLDRE